MIDLVNTAVIHGLGTQLVEVEAHMSNGIPQIIVIGLADQTIRESKERLQVALQEQGIKLGNRKYIVSLNPTDVKKQGGHLDLPIAIALLKASNVLPKSDLRIGALGGLNLSGQLIGSGELFSLVSTLVEAGCDYIIVPKSAIAMKKLFNKSHLIGLEHLSEVINLLSKDDEFLKDTLNKMHSESVTKKKTRKVEGPYCLNGSDVDDINSQILSTNEMDFKYVRGQEVAKRGIMIAVAGHHHMLMYGPPGTGKSMLAMCIPSVLPTLENKALHEHLTIQSRGGYSINFDSKVREPFRMPHSTISSSAMFGGMNANMLGEATLAHRGVLFLDEMPEFKRDVLEGLRGPLESGKIHLSKTHYKGEVSADFTLIATANPCPCGYNGFSERCNCNDRDISRYFSKLSGPILDRFDLKIQVAFKESLNPEERSREGFDKNSTGSEIKSLSSEEIAKGINKVRCIQRERYADDSVFNGTLDSKRVSKWCTVEEEGKNWLLENVKLGSGDDSMRFYNKILKVGRTIADLEGSQVIQKKHLIEAFYYNRRKII